MKVKVTKDDVLYGKKGNPNHCAVANAIRRETGRCVSVDGLQIIDQGIKFKLPLIVSLRIFFFDWLGKMSPFTLEIPDSFKKPEFKSKVKSYNLTTPSEIYHPFISTMPKEVWK